MDRIPRLVSNGEPTVYHILLRVYPDESYSADEIKQRLVDYYGKEREFMPGQLPFYRKKLSSLSEFIKDLKQHFQDFTTKGTKDGAFSGVIGLKA